MAEGGDTAVKPDQRRQEDSTAESPVATKRAQRKPKESNNSTSAPNGSEADRPTQSDSPAEQKQKRKGKKDKGSMPNTDQGEENEKNSKTQISHLKEKCGLLIEKGEYEEATKVLKEIRTLHDSDGLETQLQTIECELHSTNDSSESFIEIVKDMMAESNTLNIDEVRHYANDLKAENRNIGGIILYRITVDMIKTEKVTPNDVISYMRERAFDIGNAAKTLIDSGGRSREIGIEYGIRYLEEILTELRAVKGGDPANKADKEGKCLNSLAYLCISASLNKQAIEFAKEGLEVLDKEFGANASKHKAYGWLLNNLGTANHNACHYDVAEPYYVAAIKSYGNAVDFLSNDELKKELVLAKTNLGNSCKKLGKKTFID